MNEPLPVDPAQAGEQLGDHHHAKMAFTESVMPGVTLMAMTVVDDVEPLGFQRRGQLVIDPLRNTHAWGPYHPCSFGARVPLVTAQGPDHTPVMPRRPQVRLSFEEDPQSRLRPCDVPGCSGVGEYRAPRSRAQLNQYYWFCLDHVREYNRAWNFLDGMTDDQVEVMVRQDTVWQRPTWPLGGWRAEEDALRREADWLHGESAAAGARMDGADDPAANAAARAPTTEEDRALATLDLRPPVDFSAVKARYKSLVKRHHPDANGGSREAEERLKSINRAYSILKAAMAS